VNPQRIAVLSGFTRLTIPDFRIALQSYGIQVVFLLRGAEEDEEYFERLAKTTLDFVGNIPQPDNTLILVMLVSCEDDPVRISNEDEVFFPSARRVTISRNLMTSKAALSEAAGIVRVKFNQWEERGTYKHCLGSLNLPALLPLGNAKSKLLTKWIKRIYNFEADGFPSDISSEVARVRGGDGLLVRDLKFRGCLNPMEHPVQRHSESAACELKARLRLGVGVRERFEFDVSSTGSALKGKTFVQCDGASRRAEAATSYVNIRINDDFGFGRMK